MSSFTFILLFTLVSSILGAPLIRDIDISEISASVFHEDSRTPRGAQNEEVAANIPDLQSRGIRIPAEVIGKNINNSLHSRDSEASKNIRDFDAQERKEVSKLYSTHWSHEVGEGLDDLETRDLEVDEDLDSIEDLNENYDKRRSDSASKSRVEKEKGEIKDIQTEQKAQHKAAKQREDAERNEIDEARQRQKGATNSIDKAAAKKDKTREQEELNEVKQQNQREKAYLQSEKNKEKQELEDAKRAQRANNRKTNGN